MALISLWLPILLSAVAVFFLSFLMWMVLPHHKSDWPALPDEEKIMDALRDQGAGAGQYSFPFCSSGEQMRDPAFIKKWEDGPSGTMVIKPSGPMNMGKNLAMSFTYNVLICIFVAYVASFTLNEMTSGKVVFRLTSIVAFLGFAGAHGWSLIWWNHSWSSTLKNVIDGLVYGCAVGAIFVLCWPG